jgi:cyclopropane fatty-acyl-phospholipid synthase-like methyltransferase
MAEGLWLGTWAKFVLGMRAAPFVPTPLHVGRQMLDLAGVTATDHVFDMGSGDGRLMIQAAKLYGARCTGFEINRELCEMARQAIDREGLADRITLHQADFMQADLTQASVVLLYLSQRGNRQLLPKLRRELSPAARVVSFSFTIDDIPATRKAEVDGISVHLFQGIGQRTENTN